MATVIISILLIATIVGAWLVGATLIRNIKGTSTSSGSGAPTPPSSSSAPSSSPAPAGNGGGNWQDKARGLNLSVILISLAGVWLGAKMILIGGSISDGEIFFLMGITIIAAVLNSKLRFAAIVIGVILLLNYFQPGFNQGVKSVRETQLNPPGEMAPIIINRDGEYDLPARPLKVCFKQTGSSSTIWINQEVSIDNSWRVVENYSKCHDLPTSVSGKKVSISLGNPIKPYTPEIRKQWNITDPKITNDYEYYSNIDGGQSGYPIIQAR
jgi:hypothetical protein